MGNHDSAQEWLRYPAQLSLTEDDMLQAVKSAQLVRIFVQKVAPEFLRKEDCTI